VLELHAGNRAKAPNGFCGTPDYASIQALQGYEQGPRDDLESLGYVLLEMALDDLPWLLAPDEPSGSTYSEVQLQDMASKKEAIWRDYQEQVNSY
jgi:serine/threonine protein kinase